MAVAPYLWLCSWCAEYFFQAGVMERVDAIFRNTVWNIDYEISGMGFELAEVRDKVYACTW